MYEIPLKTVDQLQFSVMRLSAVTYLQQLLIEDTGGRIQPDDPYRSAKESAFDLLFSLQRDIQKELHDIVFGEVFA